ncbi:uncharacterized protein LOC110463011 [Mizuhopecten yessoensis]|uniref:uncharacterized protein LOC110463011 n=1 Tax=Mizuhopecten yessoensis TaxID=6573 RepID=UPI000B45DA5E|nr:uncharacterized protein LOC110463011 [Mizuhopecten yessoensis]
MKSSVASYATIMATRESLKKLSKSSIQKLYEEVGIDSKGKRKEDLIGQVITSSVPIDIITPVIRQETNVTALFPSVSVLEGTENLPPFNRVRYSVVSVTELPCPSFLAIYNFMVERSRKSVHDNVEAGDVGVSVKNFKGMDRAVRHFDAGDIQDMTISRIGDNVVYVMASCLASMKKDKYTVYLCMITNERCSVQYAYCQCPIGSAQQIPKPVSALCFNKPKLVEDPKVRSVDYDPRHPKDRVFDISDTLAELKELKKIFPNTGF